ncbi:MucR family transcriptional regulator [Hyphomonas atlantica]|uniref:Transcriptional regulator n=2 Tax=Hyphomonas atlantica TaxID=1280948 RepID=A0A356W8Q4_9PROT|nr:MucR family transcriptional regulator [Hyphomonas atlantica]HBQ50069.1 transcriptional regulator [Hyphomonas atlantica]
MIDTANPSEDGHHLIMLTTQIVAAYVSHNRIEVANLPALLKDVHVALAGLRTVELDPVAPRPAVPVRKSVGEDYLVCLEDGLKFKSLKRHLRTKYDMTPEEYREKWNLPPDYPMVAPGYSRQRSMLAKKMGLGKSERE